MYKKDECNTIGMVELTQDIDGMTAGAKGRVFWTPGKNSRVVFDCIPKGGHLPIYDFVWLDNPHGWWFDKLKPIAGPLVELVSEMLKEGEDD